jgi:hypothetical protein
VPIKHIFHSGVADGTDTSLVRPTNWNDVHSITFTQTELTEILFGAFGTGTANQFLETTGPSGTVQWATPSASGLSVSGTPLINQLTGWANAATLVALSIGSNLSLIAATLSAASFGAVSVAGVPLVNQIAGWNNAATQSAISIGNNLSLVGTTLSATGAASGGISVVPTPTTGQLAAWGNAASLLGVTIGTNVSLIGGNTLSATGGGGGVSVAGTPTAGELTGWNNAATVTSILVGAGLSLSANTLSATGVAAANYGPFLASSTYLGGASGNLCMGFFTGPGANAAPTEEGIQIAASLAVDATAQLRFPLPVSLPSSGTLGLRCLFLSSSLGIIKYTLSDAVVVTNGIPSSVTLITEAQNTVSITAVAAYIVGFTSISSPATASAVLVAALKFQTSGWTVGSSVTCIPTLGYF